LAEATTFPHVFPDKNDDCQALASTNEQNWFHSPVLTTDPFLFFKEANFRWYEDKERKDVRQLIKEAAAREAVLIRHSKAKMATTHQN
jgi:hypothetical protein